MENIPQIFTPLLNHYTWGVKRIHGTILHLQFGNPHHSIQEPIVPKIKVSEKSRQRMAHRRIFLHGVYTFIIHYADYNLKTRNYSVDTKTSMAEELDAALMQLDGQILEKAIQKNDYLHFYFDLEAELIIYMPQNNEDLEIWELVENNISSISYNSKTGLSFE